MWQSFSLLARRPFILRLHAIGKDCQNQGLGTAALEELIALFQREKGLKKMVTTYLWGNGPAKQLYEKVGFRQFQVWDEPGCHEVDLEYIPAPVGREEKGATL